MKRVVIILFFIGILAIPGGLYAQTSAGIEFQTKLVQTIVNLLHERIAELSMKVEQLETQCAVGTPALGKADNLRKEHALKQNKLDQDIIRYQQEIAEAENKIDHSVNDTIHPLNSVYKNTIKNNKKFIERAELEKRKLQAELERKLINLGEF